MSSVISVYIISKAGGLIFSHDQPSPTAEVVARFPHQQGLVLEEVDRNVVVKFGEQHGIQVGYSLVAINGQPVSNRCLPSGENAAQYLNSPDNYPLSLKFSRLKTSINERIMLLSMFHSIYAISVKLSPENKSSGIQCLEAETFKLHCLQTVTGVKFIVIADRKQGSVDDLLKKIYELYADYVLKNPFYALDMPIRCELFNVNLIKLLEAESRSSYLTGTTTA